MFHQSLLKHFCVCIVIFRIWSFVSPQHWAGWLQRCSVLGILILNYMEDLPATHLQLKSVKFKPTVCNSAAKVSAAARDTAPCRPDVLQHQKGPSIISRLYPLTVFAPVVAIKYGRAVVSGTGESTSHINPAWWPRLGCCFMLKGIKNVSRWQGSLSQQGSDWILTTGHMNQGSRLLSLVQTATVLIVGMKKMVSFVEFQKGKGKCA